MNEKLYRIPSKAALGGVCAGLSERFGVETFIIQLIFVFGAIFSHSVLLWVYIGLWIALPVKQAWDTNENLSNTQTFTNMSRKKEPNKFWGAILIGLGVIFFINEFVPAFDFGKIWPFILIGIGVYILFKDRINGTPTNNDF